MSAFQCVYATSSQIPFDLYFPQGPIEESSDSKEIKLSAIKIPPNNYDNQT